MPGEPLLFRLLLFPIIFSVLTTSRSIVFDCILRLRRISGNVDDSPPPPPPLPPRSLVDSVSNLGDDRVSLQNVYRSHRPKNRSQWICAHRRIAISGRELCTIPQQERITRYRFLGHRVNTNTGIQSLRTEYRTQNKNNTTGEIDVFTARRGLESPTPRATRTHRVAALRFTRPPPHHRSRGVAFRSAFEHLFLLRSPETRLSRSTITIITRIHGLYARFTRQRNFREHQVPDPRYCALTSTTTTPKRSQTLYFTVPRTTTSVERKRDRKETEGYERRKKMSSIDTTSSPFTLRDETDASRREAAIPPLPFRTSLRPPPLTRSPAPHYSVARRARIAMGI